MTCLQVAMLLGVQLELVRDAAGSLFQRCGAKDTFTFSEAFQIRIKLMQWGKIAHDNWFPSGK
jgi:hypothetical protein